MPENPNPVEPFGPERHLDLNADLHHFFDGLLVGKTVLDAGAGLGKSKARLRHHRVTTWDPSPHVADHVDLCQPDWPDGTWDVVTAFEVIEHVEEDLAFLRACDAHATQAVFLTTPNGDRGPIRSRHHYREYTHEEWLILLGLVWPLREVLWFAYHKDAEGGWCEPEDSWTPGLKHVVLVNKALPAADLVQIQWLYGGAR